MEDIALQQKMFDFLLDNLAFEIDQNISLDPDDEDINATIRLVLRNPYNGKWYTVGNEEIRIPPFD